MNSPNTAIADGKVFYCQYPGCNKIFRAMTSTAHPKYCPAHREVAKADKRREYYQTDGPKEPASIPKRYAGWLAVVYNIALYCSKRTKMARAREVVHEKYGNDIEGERRAKEVLKVYKLLTCENCLIREYCPRNNGMVI